MGGIFEIQRAYLEYYKIKNQVRGLTRKAEKAVERAACKKSLKES